MESGGWNWVTRGFDLYDTSYPRWLPRSGSRLGVIPPVSTRTTQRGVTGSKRDWDQWYVMRLTVSRIAELLKKECGTHLNLWIDRVYGSIGNLRWRCEYFSNDIMIWISCCLYGSKGLYIWLIGRLCFTEFVFLREVKYSPYKGWPDDRGSKGHDCVESRTELRDGGSYL